MKSKIRTVLGDIPPEKLGVTYMHEHLIIDSEIVKKNFEHIYLPSVEEAISEVLLCKKVGVQSMVDCMPTSAAKVEKNISGNWHKYYWDNWATP